MAVVVRVARAVATRRARPSRWLAERDGRVKAIVIPDVKKNTLRDVILDNVEPSSVASTDELVSHNLLAGDGFEHGLVKHGKKEYAHYDYHSGETFHVNTVESRSAASICSAIWRSSLSALRTVGE